VLEKMDRIDDVLSDPQMIFNFPNPETLSPPILKIDEATIGYSEEKPILKGVNIMVDQETRMALVGPNGAGKSTLLKTMLGKL
jgi:ATP-binding cassette subfamily F protein 3